MTFPKAPPVGLQRAGARLPLPEYTRRLWDRRWFVVAYSNASSAVGYESSFLGQAWQLLTSCADCAGVKAALCMFSWVRLAGSLMRHELIPLLQ